MVKGIHGILSAVQCGILHDQTMDFMRKAWKP